MIFKDKNVILIGLAKTGVSVVKKLASLGAKVTVTDMKTREQLENTLKDLTDLDNVNYVLGSHPDDISNFELAIISPGVPPSIPFVRKLNSLRIPIIGEVELAYLISNNPIFVGITGTNGKTTTTSLVGAICKNADRDTYVVGNIGNPVIDVVDSANEDSILVTELSSFQLDSIDTFKPHISCILNYSPDHLDRYKVMDKYIESKAGIFKNQSIKDYAVLNYDNVHTRKLMNDCPATVIPFSRTEKLDNGVYVEGDNIFIKINSNEPILLMNKSELSLPGEHNLENALASVAIAYLLEIPLEIIKNTLITFASIEHRLEYVDTINEIEFINDSKGTNPDSTIKAITSFTKPIILIAGGQNKNNEFDELIKLFEPNNIKEVVLIGETANKIRETATKLGFDNCHIVNSMEEAVKTSIKLSKPGYIVLLSPACASKDMFSNFEHRGNVFKECVTKLKTE